MAEHDSNPAFLPEATSGDPGSAGTVLLTGASAGLGLAIARLLLLSPYRLILTARRESLTRFKDLGIEPGPRVRLRELDVTDDRQRRAVVEEANDSWGGIDVLINNAGVSYRSVVEHASEAEILAQMHVNFRGPMELIRLSLPSMRRKRAGRIINISSVGGMMAMPTMAVYSASKFALEGATESLWYEVRPWNIKVTLVQPGFIHSASFRRTLYTAQSQKAMKDAREPYHAHYRAMAGFIASLMRRSRATPQQVARTVVKTMTRPHPPLRVAATSDAHLFALLRRFLPRQLYHHVLYAALPKIRSWGTEEDAAEHAPLDAITPPGEKASPEVIQSKHG